MNQKQFQSFNLVFLIAVLIITSCRRQDYKIYKVVPDNTAIVCSFSPGKLIEKSEVKDLEFIKKAMADKELNKVLFENPGMSGIDMNSNSCVFMSGTEQKFLGLVMPLKNKNVFEIFLENLGKEYNDEFIMEKRANYSFSKKRGHVLAWNKSLLIYLTRINGRDSSSVESKLAELFSLEDEKCILSEKDFKSFLSEQKDISVWVTSNQIGSLTEANMGMLSMLGAMNNNYAHFFLEFQTGAVVLSSNLRLNQDFKKSLDKFNFIDLNAEKDILKILPAEDLILAGNFRLNPDKILDIIDFFNSGSQHFLEEFENETGKKPGEVLKSIQGSVAFSINGIIQIEPDTSTKSHEKTGKGNIPVLAVAIQLNDDKVFSDFMELIKQKETVIEKNGYFVLNAHGLPFFLMLRNNFIILSNEEKYINEINNNGEVNSSLLSLDISKTLVGNPICFYLNLDRESYSAKLKNYISSDMNNKLAKGYADYGASLKSLTLTGNIEKTELRIELKDKSVNSLSAILKSMDH